MEIPRCVPEVDRVTICGCSTCAAVLTFVGLTFILAFAVSFRTQYCCPDRSLPIPPYPQDPVGQPWTTDSLQQMPVDPEERNDWAAEFGGDLGRSRESAEPVLRLVRLGSLP